MYGILILLTFFYISYVSCQADAPTIDTKYGKIQGTTSNFSYLYLGIPYALPPVNNLRWQAPIEAHSWNPNILNATSFKPGCPQTITNTSNYYDEDCLYLNVYATKKIAPNTDDKIAVLVFIHGGGFDHGDPNLIGDRMAFYGEVILVTIAYRLGALGFLAAPILAPGQISGNYGILDQRLALQWIFENIGAFGGDNQKITIFGQSAGAQSVATHLLSPNSQLFFKSAILQSGPLAWTYKTIDEAMSEYESFSNLLNCSINNIECLRNKTAKEIVDIEFHVHFEKKTVGEYWCPTIDGNIIKGQLLEIEKWISNDFKFKPFIIGSLPEEWFGSIYSRYPTYLSVDDYIRNINSTFNQYANKVLNKYPPSSNSSDNRRYMLQHILTAWSMGCSARNYTEKYMSLSKSALNNHYLYVFDYPQDFPNPKTPICYNHTCHSGDIPYTFDEPDNEFKPDGHILALQHIAYWANFAKYGTPNNNTVLDSLIMPLQDGLLYWPSFDVVKRNNIRFKAQPNEIDNNYLNDECNFFDTIGYYYN